MPNFKPKTKKKIVVDKRNNLKLDVKHDEKIKEFDDIERNIIPKLKKEKKALIKILDKKDLLLESRIEYENKLYDVKAKIKNLKNKKKEYYLENSKYIFDYFEDKKKLSEGGSQKTRIVNEFFNIKNGKQNEITQNSYIDNYFKNMDENNIDIEQYLYDYDVCPCGGEFIPVDNKGIMICKKCSKQEKFLIEHEKPSYKEPPKEVCFYAYKRINHFREILAQFQAKETTQIPDEVLDNIKKQIKKERITLKQITNKKAKDILKKLGYNKYYEHIPFIKDKLGIKPPVMTPALEEKLCNLFMEIQKPYSKHCPKDRVNFLNYYYVLYKMCELLDEKKYLSYFPMLKDPVKIMEQDDIWKKICKELKWQFYMTKC